MSDSSFFADELGKLGEPEKSVTVTLSNELVALLSEQLYQSPIKAIEELVVNAFDADAHTCKLFVPSPLEFGKDSERRFVSVFDDGHGMAYSGLVDLWQIGRSEKRDPKRYFARAQIGKFGIGKLATYTIANRLTYLTKTKSGLLAVSIDFREFQPSSGSRLEPVELAVRRLPSIAAVDAISSFHRALENAKVTTADTAKPTWTIVLLEDLKEKAVKITLGRLKWVISTAMPLATDFKVFLNGEQIESSKQSFEKLVEFEIKDISPRRIEALTKSLGEDFKITKGGLFSPTFPGGIFGSAIVTRRSLVGKSDELGRSHGFFIRVRGRVINEDDPFFGLSPLSHQTFNRFRAEILANDLDQAITAPREGIEYSEAKSKVEGVLKTVFAEARERYENTLKAADVAQTRQREGTRAFVPVELVEYPVADLLSSMPVKDDGPEADRGWFYMSVPAGSDLRELARGLYAGPRKKYRFDYQANGRNERLVKFDPSIGTFFLNQDHPFVLAHADNPRAQLLLEDFVFAEVLLEVYLKERGIPGGVIGEVLELRDKLLRNLPNDHPYSLKTIAASLRDSASNERDLEMALVAAARALGFVAVHVSGADQPDGIARYVDYPAGEKAITLEAKSSGEVPSLAAIDFAGLSRHVKDHSADGCLLVAPSYPGANRGDYSAAARSAEQLQISCWTIDQLASVVEAVETKKVSAKRVIDVVLKAFAPEQVSSALERVFGEARWELPALYEAIVTALRSLEGQLPNTIRNVSHIAVKVAADPRFAGIDEDDVFDALLELSAASKGALELRDRNIVMLSSIDEIERHLAGLLHNTGVPRRPSELREPNGA